MRKIYLLIAVVLFAAASQAQVTGTKTIGTDYPTIAAAVTALNTAGVGAGGATINVPSGYTETAPSGGIVLGSTALNASLSASNTLTFVKTGTGANPLITAPVGTSTAVDGIFKLAGTDYVTINGINLQESAANTTATTAMEAGYALINLNATAPFDGCNNNTITNCTITLNRTIATPSAGILCTHITATSGTALAITAATDLNSNNKIYSNTITNTTTGILFSGFSATTPFALYDQGNDIGGTSAATGNTITNFGGTNFTSIGGITFANQNAGNVSFNTLNQLTNGGASSVGAVWGIYTFGTNSTFTVNNNAVTLSEASINTSYFSYGIYSNAAGTILTANNNTISQEAITATSAVPHYGIYFTGGVNLTANTNNITQSQTLSATTYGIYTTATGVISIGTNTIKQTSTGTISSTFAAIYASGTGTSLSITNNIASNTNLTTTGTYYFAYCSNSTPNVTVTGNSFAGNFVKSGAGGTVYGFYNNGSPGSGTAALNNNNFSNVTLSGATNFYGLYSNGATGQIVNENNNTFTNITTGTGSIYGLWHSYGAVGSTANGNTISGLSGAGTVYGMQVGNVAALGMTVSGNTVSNLTSTGAFTVYGILYSGGANGNVFKNKISGLTGNNAGSTVYGLTIAGGGTSLNVYNNLIGDLNAPAATSATDAIRGINITATSTATAINLYNNTVYINATSTGANFSSSALFATTTTPATAAALTFKNNILYNTSVPKGTGFTSAYRRSSTTLTNYTASSNNMLYAGTGSANNAIYYDGTTAANTICAFQAAVTPRDANSFTETATPFVATTGTGATFLHISTSTPTLVEAGGTPVATVTDDYDGDARNATTPDVGADEFAGIRPAACSGTPTAGTITGNVNVCQGLSNLLTLTGASTGAGTSIQWQSSTTSGGPYTNIACATGTTLNTGIIPPGTTVYYVAVITCANGGATATTPQFAVTSFATPTVAVTPATASICSNGTGVSLTASGAATYTWSPATGLSAATGATVTANPAATTTYTVTGTTAQGCIGTGSASVTVNTAPVAPTVTPTAATICAGGIQMITATPASGNPNLLNENFNTVAVGAIPTGWTKLEPTITTIWGAVASASAGGTANEMKLECINSTTSETGTYALISPVLSGTGVTNLVLTFKDSLALFSTSATYAMTVNVETSTDNVTWTNRWTYSNAGGSIGHHPQTVNLSALDNQGAIYVRFSLIGKPFAAFRWFIDDVALTGTAAPATVTWSPAAGLYTNAAATTPYVTGASATTVYASPTATTTYSASVTGAGGCISSTTTTVTVNTPPTITTQPANQAICAGTPVTFTAVAGGSTGTYQWQVSTNGGGTFTNIAGATAATYTIAAPTVAMNNNQYHLVVTNGCGTITSSNATLTVSTPNAATIAYTATPYCIGSGTATVTQTGTTGGTYTAAPAGLTINATTGAITLSSSTAGTYTVTYSMAANGSCPATTTTASVTINAPSVAPTSATASTPAICGVSGTVTLTAVGGILGTGASYKWYTGSCGGTLLGTGATLSNIFVNQTTTYYVRAEGICGNTACASVTVTVNPVPAVVLTASSATGGSTTTNPANVTGLYATVSAPGNYVYSWTRDGVTLPVLTSSITAANGLLDAFGTYQVRVTNVTTGCSAVSNTIKISDIAGERNQLFISPNPTTGVTYLTYYSSSTAAEARTINVYDSKGSRIMSESYSVTGPYGRMKLDLSALNPGVYMVELRDASGKRVKTEQIIKN